VAAQVPLVCHVYGSLQDSLCRLILTIENTPQERFSWTGSWAIAFITAENKECSGFVGALEVQSLHCQGQHELPHLIRHYPSGEGMCASVVVVACVCGQICVRACVLSGWHWSDVPVYYHKNMEGSWFYYSLCPLDVFKVLSQKHNLLFPTKRGNLLRLHLRYTLSRARRSEWCERPCQCACIDLHGVTPSMNTYLHHESVRLCHIQQKNSDTLTIRRGNLCAFGFDYPHSCTRIAAAMYFATWPYNS